eukprot:CAMPEP_0183829296 /NCGR_PEP_ID=MMETSP0807_2-20130328/3233_1 /TAXON_ID=88271 /ORGANISM="Picocystis salinarum, Strain CCMP1897" /LENGTH=499 /DNA_ID=CAMNT_0026074503 /DNA_START=57 /DNA_END=1556 /DNA_ORIENTATION=+
MPKQSNQQEGATHERSWTTAITEHDFGSGTPRQERGDYRDSSRANPSHAPHATAAHGRLMQNMASNAASSREGNARQAQLQAWLGSVYPSAQVYPGNPTAVRQPTETSAVQVDPRNPSFEEDILNHVRTYSPFSTYIRALPSESPTERNDSAVEREALMGPPMVDAPPGYLVPEGFAPTDQAAPVRPAPDRLQNQDVSYQPPFPGMQQYPRMTQVIGQDGKAYYMIPAAELYPHGLEQRMHASTQRSGGQHFARLSQGDDAQSNSIIEQVDHRQRDWHPTGMAPAQETHAQAPSTGRQALNMPVVEKTTRKRNTPDASECCHCKKSQCLKMYCVCFAQGVFCKDNCQCIDCHNKMEFLENVNHAKMEIKRKNPRAFESKLVKVSVGSSGSMPMGNTEPNWEAMQHKIGCKCSRTKCMKKYCECYRANVPCSLRCVCVDCKNPFGQAGVTHDGQSIRMVPVAATKPHDRAHSTGLEYFVQRSLSPTPPSEATERGYGTSP